MAERALGKRVTMVRFHHGAPMKAVIERALAGETVKLPCRGRTAQADAKATRKQVIDAALEFTTRPVEVLIMGMPPNMEVWVRVIGESEIKRMQQMSSDHPRNKKF